MSDFYKYSFEDFMFPEPNSGCYLWDGSYFDSGYGRWQECNKALRAHRVSYAKYKGKIPFGLKVLHRCDNKACVNPEHLYLGTNKRNTRDALQRKRFCVGDRHDKTKIPDAEIKKIMYDCRPNTVICKEYGVSDALIGQIKRGVTRKHITDPQYHDD